MRPPANPWTEFEFPEEPEGILVAFLSDDTCNLPVRHVTRVGDNKADPNLETGTYGLFTTCYRASRSGTVGNRRRWLFFTTKHQGTSKIAGYYDLRWYAKHPGRWKDYALAAETTHFVEQPIITQDVYDEFGIDKEPLVRGSKRLSHEQCQVLLNRLREQSDATHQYTDEIHRLERVNKKNTGYRHIGLGREEPFTWDDAAGLLTKPHSRAVAKTQSGKNRTEVWKCRECGCLIEYKACLRRCRECGAVHTLEVAEKPEDATDNDEENKDPSLFAS